MRARYVHRTRTVLVALALASSLTASGGAAPSVAGAAPYILQDLGALPGETDCIPFGINAWGQVVGSSGNRAFLFSDGIGMIELPPLPGASRAVARGINDAGAAVGESWGAGTPYHAARWTGGVPTDLGAVQATSRAWDISPSGEVVGETPVDDLGSDAFLYSVNSGMDLLAPAHYASHAYDINDAGQVAGSMTVYNAYHAFRFTPGSDLKDLGVLEGFLQSIGKAINISGQVAGDMSSATGNTQRLFRFTDGIGMVNLGGLGQNSVEGMNSRGDFVGRGLPDVGIERAFLYTDEGGLQDLERLIDTALGWRLLYAFDINDAGQIVGLAWSNPLSSWRGYRLTPTTPVGPIAALSFSPLRVEGGRSVSGWATLTLPAPAGGAVVVLSSADPQAVTVPTSVSIPAGERHGQFTLTTSPVASTALVEVSAEYQGSVRTRALEVGPAELTSVGGGPGGTAVLLVHAVTPNPASESATLHYELTRPADVVVRIYDAGGRLIRVLVDSAQFPGQYRAVWDGHDQTDRAAPTGLYFVRIEAGGLRYERRFALLH